MRVIKWGKGSLFVYVFKKYRFLLKNTGLWASKYRFVFPEVGMSGDGHPDLCLQVENLPVHVPLIWQTEAKIILLAFLKLVY